MLLIEAVGPGTTVQDGGRYGFLRFGVTPAGPMDPFALATANRALGNPAAAAAVELCLGGLTVKIEVSTSVAFAGGDFRWFRNEQPLPAAARVLLRAGDVLRARAGSSGAFCYLAVPGGIDVPEVMGSRATHLRSALGGLEGRALRVGDRLPVGGTTRLDDGVIAAPWLAPSNKPIRVVLGPQDDLFTEAGVKTFLDTEWNVTGAADRMAFKLDGAVVEHAADFNIVTDGVALGAVQIAGDGKPMVLMADRQPTGGYAKIAHVARVDIGRLAQTRPGETVRFTQASADEARTALVALKERVGRLSTRLNPLRLTPPVERLFSENLIGGVTLGR